MSFFEPPPPPDQPDDDVQPTEPDWFGPPHTEIGVAVPLRRLLFRDDDVAVAIVDLVAYSNGFELQLQVRRRKRSRGLHPMPFRQFDPDAEAGTISPRMLRFGIRFADGSKATNTHSTIPAFDKAPDGPILFEGGGGGDDRRWESSYWVWPLPPAGPLSVVVEWPSERIPLTEVELDASAILAAAAQVERLWPDD